MTESGEVIVQREGTAGVIRLNRPKALNALTLSMVREINGALDDFEGDPGIALILLEGEGGRAFCAGGDIRAIAEAGRAGTGEAERFWREEYELNARIASFQRAVVVLMDGIVMGGGAGLSIHARHRIVTDRTRFAMPEVGIGFIPDVGATYRLPRAPGGFGRFLALTGEIVGAADVIAAGLADAMVPADRLAGLRNDLIGARAAHIEEMIARHAAEAPAGVFAAHGPTIARAFGRQTIEEVLEALAADGSDFAEKTRQTILSRSPTSLRDTETLLWLGAKARTLEECLIHEYVAAIGTLARPDYYEGVRAAVIDKDRNPKWSPATLAEAPVVPPERFAPQGDMRPPFTRQEAAQ
ncbi:enoyl-CoA hydratase/isomerase family protein [Aureimonas mangrovi]|uniref:enoyl-CoA hydratase/isomerase family protein n=1 Tax=Aureimonas mangrovi TaxID=2758041 RepID=UPI00163D8B79|nr:enoyl-CoA hydratase/isomerase family protein [Aureimonas mangrovi]